MVECDSLTTVNGINLVSVSVNYEFLCQDIKALMLQVNCNKCCFILRKENKVVRCYG